MFYLQFAFLVCVSRSRVFNEWRSLKCSASGELASDEQLTEPCEKPMLADVVEIPSMEIPSIFAAVDGKASVTYAPDTGENCSLRVRL